MYSSIAGNRSLGGFGGSLGGGRGGGIWSQQPVSLDSCLVADNFATLGGGVSTGYQFNPSGNDGAITLVNSTISRNSAATTGAGLLAYGPITASNSTIVYNALISNPTGSGVTTYRAAAITLQNSIVARNGYYPSAPIDISGKEGTVIVGANNVVTHALLTVPPGTISADPHIGPLVDNGGPTRTHSLLRGSPAINAANSTVPRMYDQRGSPHGRELGGRQDIGAFESDPDQVFASRFE